MDEIINNIFKMLLLISGIILLNSCEKNNEGENPIIIKSPQFKQVEGLTDKIKVEFYYQLNADGKITYCDFYWTDDQKFSGTCPTIQPGDYTYTFNLITIETKKILATSSDRVTVGKNNTIEIELVLDFDIREDGAKESNLKSFLLKNRQPQIPTDNKAPIANAGDDKNVLLGTKVALNGTDRTDAINGALSFTWALVSQPENSTVSLFDSETQNPFLTPDVIGEYQIELVVNDGTVDSLRDIVTITAVAEVVPVVPVSAVVPVNTTTSPPIQNLLPYANAGLDRQVESGEVVMLDGSGSNDSDGTIVSYLWVSEDSNIGLSRTYTATTMFIAPIVNLSTSYNIKLTVTDNEGETDSKTVVFTIVPRSISLVAILGVRRTTVNLGTTFFLYGAASTDPTQAGLTYVWRISSNPEGSAAVLSNVNVANPTFLPDLVGSYSVELTVSDGLLSDTTTLKLVVVDVLAVVKPEMVVIPKGKFQMGDETEGFGAGNSDELPRHWVTITAFEMGKYEVTFDEYDQYLNAIGGSRNQALAAIPGQQPVTRVSWLDVQSYLDWLNTGLGIALDNPKRYRLPSEAEWEYATRAGTKTAFNTGDCINQYQASYSSTPDGVSYIAFSYTKFNGTAVNCSETNRGYGVTVTGSFPMNGFGLFNTHGNVSEWLNDCYHDSYVGAPTNGSAWIKDCTYSDYIVRGGSWINSEKRLRSASRLAINPGYRSSSVGFRLARTLSFPNEVPIANAGNNLSAPLNTEVTLNGNNSTDANNDALTFAWLLTMQPQTSTASLVDTQSQTPTITPDVIGEYKIKLVVNDGLVDSTKDVITISAIAANTVNIPPTVSAGLNRQVTSGDTVILSASSVDSDGSIESYRWLSIDSSVSLSGTSTAATTFVAPTVSTLTTFNFDIRVTDNDGEIASDSVTITIVPPLPVEELNLTAIANADRATVTVGRTVTFDGAASIGSNKDNIMYEWGIVSSPEGSTAFLSNRSSTTPTFIPDIGGSYIIGLTVKDERSIDATYLRLKVFEVSNITLPKMKIIPAGSFKMGDESTYISNERPVRDVTLLSFEMGAYEVSFDEYDQYLNATGKAILLNQSSGEGADESWGRSQRPVINVSWDDAQSYLIWLNTQLDIALDDPKRYRLPTEAEWEYAVRGQTTVDAIRKKYYWGDTINHNDTNYGLDNCCSGLVVTDPIDTYLNTAPVGMFAPNLHGLYDMHGNVLEWVEDCYHDSYIDAPIDGSAWLTNCENTSWRTLRGGSWRSSSMDSRSASRRYSAGRVDSVGFRLSRSY